MKNRLLLLTVLLFFVFSSPAYAQTWSNVSPPWAAANRTAYSMVVYGADLYVGTNNTGGAQVWQYDGTAWTNVSPAWAAANVTVLGMVVYGANLYVGTL